MRKKIDLTGQVFGILAILKEGEPYVYPDGKKKTTKWLCQCKCGNTVEVRTDSLTRGDTKSCGCLQKAGVTKHGHCKKDNHTRRSTIEYSCWAAMKARCYIPSQKGYENYGGRGIVVCDEWKDDFQAFYNYIGECPIGCNSIDRIDVNGNYEPGNVRWSNPIEQARNKREATKLTEQDVREIKYLINIGEKIKTIANLYKVSSGHIYNIKYGKSWKDVA